MIRTLQGSSIVGLAASLYLTFLEVFVIRSLCIYCLASAFIALLIFISALFFMRPPRETDLPV